MKLVAPVIFYFKKRAHRKIEKSNFQIETLASNLLSQSNYTSNKYFERNEFISRQISVN